MILTESGTYGYVIDTERRPYLRIADDEDLKTAQYNEAQLMRG